MTTTIATTIRLTSGLVAALALCQGCSTAPLTPDRQVDFFERRGTLGICDRGLFEAEHVKRTPSAETPTGYALWLRNERLVKSTSVVPARSNTVFGVVFYTPSALTNAPARFVWSLPSMRNPHTGKVFSTFELAVSLPDRPKKLPFYYMLMEDYELVEGTWTLSIFVKEKLAAREKFKVVKAPF